MASICTSNCVKDTNITARVPVILATYVNLYKWPESDAEFVKSVGSASGSERQGQHPRVVDSVSCRQLYLRSYTFSRKETLPEKTKKCIGRVKQKVSNRRRRGCGRRRCTVARRVKELSCATLCAIFQKLLSCTSTIDVVDGK